MKQSKNNPQNQYALVIWLLIENKTQGVTMVEAMRYYLHKFQTRLLELEKSLDSEGKPRHLKLKIRRLPMTTKNRFNHSCTYTNYKSLASISYLNNLYKKINKTGLSDSKKQCTFTLLIIRIMQQYFNFLSPDTTASTLNSANDKSFVFGIFYL